MGVPSFYRWISLRYPHCVTSIRQAQPGDVPEEEQNYDEDEEPVDNLYIDMNGIIHPCFHPEDGPQPKTEDEVFALIIKKVESLIAVAKPRKVLYLAIDGPAPRAKMNQQRARRFRAAQEAEQKRRIEAELRERILAGELWRREQGEKAWQRLIERLRAAAVVQVDESRLLPAPAN